MLQVAAMQHGVVRGGIARVRDEEFTRFKLEAKARKGELVRLHVCVCVRKRARACVRVRACACVCARACACVCVTHTPRCTDRTAGDAALLGLGSLDRRRSTDLAPRHLGRPTGVKVSNGHGTRNSSLHYYTVLCLTYTRFNYATPERTQVYSGAPG